MPEVSPEGVKYILNMLREHDKTFEILEWIDKNVEFGEDGCFYKEMIENVQ